MRKCCVECRLPYDYNRATGNPHWCPKCDEVRKAKIIKQLEDLSKYFDKLERGTDENNRTVS
jgi:transcription initiation factor IIE alpha subunit